jgi:two-component system sensor histidine kinase KdpD
MQGAAGWLGALSAPVLATAAASAFDGRFSIAGLSMFYLLAVVAGAMLPKRSQAALCAVLSVTVLNYFFVPPRGSLSVAEPEYLWVLGGYLALALGLSTLVERLRSQRASARAAFLRSAQARELSGALQDSGGWEEMARTAARVLFRLTGHPSAVFAFDGTVARRWPEDTNVGFEEKLARWAVESGRAAGRGCADWPDLPLWCAPFSRRGASGAVQVAVDRSAELSPQDLAHWAELVAIIGTAIERERASAAARAAKARADAEAARNTMLASLAHDLRTPLAGLVGSASALREQGSSMTQAQRDRLLANIEAETLDLSSMAEDVLATARFAQPGSAARLQWESLEDILGDAVIRMRRRWPQASIQLRCPTGLPLVQAEAGLLAQAIANLVDNAVRHGGQPGKVVVQAGRSRAGVFVAVRDHGQGLPPGDPTPLFERYQPGAQSSAAGSGLGLAICQLVARLHAGQLTAKRAQPGTEFRIDLPASNPGEES